MSMSQPGSIGESLKLILGGDQDRATRLPIIRTAFEQVARDCVQQHLELTESGIKMSLADIESGPPEELMARIDTACIPGVLLAPGWDCNIYSSADRPLAFMIAESFLGGDGGEPVYSQERALSHIEKNLLRLFFQQVADALTAVFALDDDDAIMAGEPAGEIDADALAGENDFIALASFDVEIMGQAGQLHLALPPAALDGFGKALSNASAALPPAPDEGWRRHIRTEFGRSSVTLAAILEKRPSTLEEVSSLKVGQIMQLAATPQDLVRVECNGERMFWCRLGQSNGVYTLQIEDHVDSSQEFIQDVLTA